MFREKEGRRNQKQSERLVSGPRPPISRGCCRFRDRIRGSACRSRPRLPRRARNTRRGVTRIPDTKHVTSPIPTRWRGKARPRFRPRPRSPFPPRPRRGPGKTSEAGRHNRSGNGGNSSPARPRTGRATSESIPVPSIESNFRGSPLFQEDQFLFVSILPGNSRSKSERIDIPYIG